MTEESKRPPVDQTGGPIDSSSETSSVYEIETKKASPQIAAITLPFLARLGYPVTIEGSEIADEETARQFLLGKRDRPLTFTHKRVVAATWRYTGVGDLDFLAKRRDAIAFGEQVKGTHVAPDQEVHFVIEAGKEARDYCYLLSEPSEEISKKLSERMGCAPEPMMLPGTVRAGKLVEVVWLPDHPPYHPREFGVKMLEGTQKWAARYIELGLAVIPKDDGTGHNRKGWKNDKPGKPEEFRPTDAIAFLPGQRSGGVVDLDYDNPVASKLGPMLFAGCPAFGHSERVTHQLVKCPDLKRSVAYDPAPFGMLCEILASNKATILPPSVKDDNKRTWMSGDPTSIPEMSRLDIERRMGLIAFVSLFVAKFPRESRHKHLLTLGGVLSYMSINDDDKRRLLDTILDLLGDRVDAEKRREAHDCLKSAQAKLDDDETNPAGPRAYATLIGHPELANTLWKWLNPKQPGEKKAEAADLPEGAIFLDDPDTDMVVRQIEAKWLATSCPPMFRQDRQLVRIFRTEAPETVDGVKRAAGAAKLVEADPRWIALQLSSRATFTHLSYGKVELCPPKPKMMELLEVSVEDRSFPPISGLTFVPTTRRNEPGYDPATGVWHEYQAGEYTIPERPTREDAIAAYDVMMTPVSLMPYASKLDEAVMASLILTAVIRGELPTAPAFIFDANQPGSGKSHCVNVVAIVATGVYAAVANWPTREEEIQKTLHSVLAAGDPVIMFDNVKHTVDSQSLDAVLTSPLWQGRELGSNRSPWFSIRRVFTFNGNAIRFNKDGTRRGIMCSLFVSDPDPEERDFPFKPTDKAMEMRKEIIIAALTILRAYEQSGGLEKRPKAFGNFEEWSQRVREALLWIGKEDPVATKDAVKSRDPDREARAELIQSLLCFVEPGEEFTVPGLEGKPHAPFSLGKLIHGKWDRGAMGRLLYMHKGRDSGGVTLVSTKRGDITRWVIEGTPSQELLADVAARKKALEEANRPSSYWPS